MMTLGNGSATVGRAVASVTRGHVTVYRKDETKEKEMSGMVIFFKTLERFKLKKLFIPLKQLLRQIFQILLVMIDKETNLSITRKSITKKL